jgi:hypothetical protein
MKTYRVILNINESMEIEALDDIRAAAAFWTQVRDLTRLKVEVTEKTEKTG